MDRNRWTDGWVDELGGWKRNGWTHGKVDGWMDRKVDGWVNGQRNEKTDGWMGLRWSV